MFTIEPFELVVNRTFSFFKLLVNGKSLFDEFTKDIKNIKDEKALSGIIALMDNFGSCLLPNTKFRKIQGTKRDDLFEFKKNNIRVYVLKKEPSIFVVLGGYKTKQKSDIARMDKILSDLDLSRI